MNLIWPDKSSHILCYNCRKLLSSNKLQTPNINGTNFIIGHFYFKFVYISSSILRTKCATIRLV